MKEHLLVIRVQAKTFSFFFLFYSKFFSSRFYLPRQTWTRSHAARATTAMTTFVGSSGLARATLHRPSDPNIKRLPCHGDLSQEIQLFLVMVICLRKFNSFPCSISVFWACCKRKRKIDPFARNIPRESESVILTL